ncbi:MAG: DUF3788 family protein [Acholeplasmataceae bacterium]|nr:DUF3788 family protein [Acholeplasmataceae bacterium]
MKTTKEQVLRNPDVQPSREVIAEALGEANKVYISFLDKLVDYNIDLVWHYYNDGKAWLAKGLYKWTGLRGGQNEKTIFWLSMWKGFFKLTFYFPEEVRGDLLGLTLDDELKQMIAGTEQMGKLRFFPLSVDLYADEMFETIQALISFKKSIK